VLNLILIVLLLWVVLTILLAAWTLWFQSYIYSEPTTGIAWRGPAAGSALMVVLLLWLVLDFRAPGRYRPLFESASRENSPPFAELRIPKHSGGEDVYRLRPRTNLDYRLNGRPDGKPLPTRPQRIIVVEGEERYTFEPERDAKGNFKTRTTSSWFGSSQSDDLRYIDNKGRVMVESSLGQLSTFRGSWLFGNLVVNFLLLAVAFVVLWLLLCFQWPHALGQAVVLWVVLLLFVLPPVLTRAETVAKQRAEARRLAE
jgi:hypothetical protein